MKFKFSLKFRFLPNHKILRRIIISIFLIIAVPLLILLILALAEGAGKPPFELGVTFRQPYAEAIGLDWKQTYSKMFSDLHVKNIRISAYWNSTEPQQGKYNFSDLDYQMNVASQNKAKIVFAIGRRVPGWPECHIPDWANSLAWDDQQKALEAEMTAIINRYKDNPSLQYWQVENEPFLVRFGKCPQYDVAKYLDSEIALVRKLDPNRPIIVTDSGELSVWIRAANRADVFGSTLYRKVYADSFGRYITYHWPPLFFRAKLGFVHLFRPHQQIINVELQGEPWTTNGLDATPFSEQALTFAPEDLVKNIQFAHDSGFSTTYLWGVEYWYWAAAHGHPEYLQEAERVFNQ